MRNLVLAALAAAVLLCPGIASAQASPTVVVPPATISAICATPGSGCSAGQWVTASIGGRNSISATVIPSVFTGTFSCYFSKDGGANWVLGLIRSSATDQVNTTNSYSLAVSFAASSTTSFVSCLDPYSGATDVAVVSTAAVTNTASVTLALSASSAHLLEGTLSAKGSQSINSYLGVQEPKDAGRSFIVLGADGVTPATSETLITFSQNKGGAVTGSATTYAITSGKTLRLQSLTCSLTAGAATNRVRIAVRLNTAGACTAASGLLMPAMELSPAYGTAAASQGGAFGSTQFPDGLELTGASWNVCLSESAAAASGTLTCTLVGFEY